MQSLAVVKDLKLFKYSLSSLSPGLIGLLMYQFGFQGMKKAFRDGIIPAVAFTTHTLPDAVLF